MLTTILVGQTTSTCFGCCHPPDLPGQLTKARAAPRYIACCAPLGQHSGPVGPWEAKLLPPPRDSTVMKSPWSVQLVGDNTRDVSLFLISSYEFPLLATAGCRTLGWMDFQSGLVVLVFPVLRKPKSSLEALAAARLLHLPSQIKPTRS